VLEEHLPVLFRLREAAARAIPYFCRSTRRIYRNAYHGYRRRSSQAAWGPAVNGSSSADAARYEEEA